MGTKFVITTTTTRNTCPTQIPTWHPQKHQDLRWVQSLLFQEEEEEETHVPPRSQHDIPKNIRTCEMGIAVPEEVCGEQEEFLSPYFAPPHFLSSSTSDHTSLPTTYLFCVQVVCLFVCLMFWFDFDFDFAFITYIICSIGQLQ
jgi:hypothetical protein